MDQQFTVLQTSRNLVLTVLENHTLEQLNFIPEGFNNNLIWNIGHIVVTQQLLGYKLSGLPMMVSDEMIEKYKKGSAPKEKSTQIEVDQIKSLLFATINQTKEDYLNKIFKNYHEYSTSTGYVLRNIEDAISFNNFHEGIHFGIIMSLKKLV